MARLGLSPGTAPGKKKKPSLRISGDSAFGTGYHLRAKQKACTDTNRIQRIMWRRR